MYSQQAQGRRVYTTYTRRSTWTGTEKHPHKRRQHQWPHPDSLSGWAGWRSTGEYIDMHMHKVDSPSSWAQTLSLPSSCPWIPVSLHMDIGATKTAAQLQLLVQTIPQGTYTRAHAQCWSRCSWCPSSQALCPWSPSRNTTHVHISPLETYRIYGLSRWNSAGS